jgi:hypothetical protein
MLNAFTVFVMLMVCRQLMPSTCSLVVLFELHFLFSFPVLRYSQSSMCA